VTYKLLWIGAAGALGTLARYGLAGIVQRHAGGSFPFGTAAVNIAGCLLAGFLWALAENRLNLGGEIRACVFIGFMGAFTTFSTFILETTELLRSGEYLYAAGNIVFQNAAGVFAFILGMTAGLYL
jgi:CrcB protein